MKILITGGCGFQGAHLARYWARVGHDVCTLNTPSARAQRIYGTQLRSEGIVGIWGSVTDEEVVRKAAEQKDVIVHMAAWANPDASIEDPIATLQVNISGTYNVLDAARREGARVILASSCEVYGTGRDLTTASPMNPQSPYAASKVAADRLAFAYSQTYRVPIVILRPCNIYGPLQRALHHGAVISTFICRALDGDPLQVHWTGVQEREFMYVDDVVTAYDAVLRTPEAMYGAAFNVGSGEVLSIRRVAEHVIEQIGGKIEYTEGRPSDVSTFLLDSDLFRSYFHWSAKISFADGLRRYIEWVKQ